MIIKDLGSIELSIITESFNEAFADYIMQFTATEEYLRNRWMGAGVDYNLSFGAFINDKLVGFIIHGIDKYKGVNTAFNVGTGVIPIHRGNRIIKKIYDHAIPILKNNGIELCGLEVIQENDKAIKAYKSVGFREKQELISFTFDLDSIPDQAESDAKFHHKIEKNIKNVDWDLVKTFWDFEPSWENSSSSLLRNPDQYEFIGIYKEDDELLGYAIIIPKTGYIPQFAIAKNKRGKGYAKGLFKNLTQISKKLAIINVDGHSSETLNFLKAYGFKVLISQFEMEKNLI
ncbi:MAG: GNAT family N-acetyltransferase [Candidatus Hodarchaeales archaeon]